MFPCQAGGRRRGAVSSTPHLDPIARQTKAPFPAITWTVLFECGLRYRDAWRRIHLLQDQLPA
jgi:hypothetical protein